MTKKDNENGEQSQSSPFLTVAEAANYLRLGARTLDNLRWIGTGPKFRKHGGRIVYHKDDLDAWSRTRLRISTSGERHED